MSLFANGGPASPHLCERYADELILLDEPGPETPERIAARTHLAECQRCQQDQHAMRVASTALRGHVRTLMAQAPTFTEAEIAARAAQQPRSGETRRQPSKSDQAIKRQRREKHLAAADSQVTSSHTRSASPFLRRALSVSGSVAAVALITGLLVATLTGHLLGRSSGARRLVTPSNTAVPLSRLNVYAPARQMGATTVPALAAYRASDGALEPLAPGAPSAPVTAWGTVFAQGVRYQLILPDTVSDPNARVPATLSATRMRDGQLLWTEHIDPIFTPNLVLVNGVLYMGAPLGGPGVDARVTVVLAYRASDGALLWRRTFAAQLNGSPIVSQGMVYFIAGNTAIALRAGDGATLWQTTLRTGGPNIISAWQTAASGALYIYASLESSSGQKDATGVDVFALRLTDGSALWHAELGTDIFPADGPFAPVVADGVVYVRLATVKFTSPVMTLRLFALRAADGSTLWRYTSTREETGDMGIPNIYPPAASDGVVYVTEDGGALTALAASDGHTIWRVNVDPAPGSDTYPDSINSPVVVDGAVFVIGDGWLVAVRASDGGTMWRAASGTPRAPMNYQPYHLVVGP